MMDFKDLYVKVNSFKSWEQRIQERKVNNEAEEDCRRIRKYINERPTL